MLAAGVVPLEPYRDSKTPWRSRCLACDGVVAPTYNHIQQTGYGCRHCGIARRARSKMRDAATMDVAYRRLGGIPAVPYPGVDKPWPGQCTTCARSLSRTWKAIETSGYFCTYCSGERVIPEEAFAAMIAAGCIPLDPYGSSGAKWRCQCHRCHRTIYPRYDSIKSGQSPCAYCAHRLVDPDEARQVMIDAGAIPESRFPGALKPWASVCSRCAQPVTPVYNNVLKGHDPCLYCSGNQISESDAHALVATHHLQPLEPFRQAGLVWRCRCVDCGSTARVVLTRLKFSGSRGCPACQRSGFRRLAPAQVYLLHNDRLDVYKIGVTNQFNYRIREHSRFGFAPLVLPDGQRTMWPVSLGQQALVVEAVILQLWRVTMRLPQALTPDDMPQHGATETARLTNTQLELTLALLNAECHAVA
jgi:hypothetical protein